MANLAGDGPLDGVGLLHGDDLLHGHSNVADLQKASSREVEGLWMTVAGENLVVAGRSAHLPHWYRPGHGHGDDFLHDLLLDHGAVPVAHGLDGHGHAHGLRHADIHRGGHRLVDAANNRL